MKIPESYYPAESPFCDQGPSCCYDDPYIESEDILSVCRFEFLDELDEDEAIDLFLDQKKSLEELGLEGLRNYLEEWEEYERAELFECTASDYFSDRQNQYDSDFPDNADDPFDNDYDPNADARDLARMEWEEEQDSIAEIRRENGNNWTDISDSCERSNDDGWYYDDND